MKFIATILFMLFLNQLFAQMPSYMKLIEGGTFQMNSGYAFYYKDYRMILLGQDSTFNNDGIAIGEKPEFNNVGDRRVTVADFYLSDHEVTNEEYMEFLLDSVMRLPFNKTVSAQLMDSIFWKSFKLSCSKAGLLPDTACWSNFSQNSFVDPMDIYYLRHPTYRKYPVVGVSWVQAKAYCEWLTCHVNKKGGQMPAFRLPTEAEWEYACNAGRVKNSRKEFEAPFPPYQFNFKTGNGVYYGDKFTYTAPIKSYKPNENGMYDMRGNAAEWCEDVFRERGKQNDDFEKINNRNLFRSEEDLKIADLNIEQYGRVVKGGSWADYFDAALSGS